MFAFFHFCDDLSLSHAFTKLLVVEVFVVLEELVLEVVLTLVAPVGEICEREHHRVVGLLVVLHHVHLDVAGAEHFLTGETYPVFSNIRASSAFIIHVYVIKLIHRLYVLANAVRTIFFRDDREHSLNLLVGCLLH